MLVKLHETAVSEARSNIFSFPLYFSGNPIFHRLSTDCGLCIGGERDIGDGILLSLIF